MGRSLPTKPARTAPKALSPVLKTPGTFSHQMTQGGSPISASNIVNCVRKADELHREVAPVAAEGGPKARKGEVLTGGAPDQHVGITDPRLIAHEGEVAFVPNPRPPLDLIHRPDRSGARARLGLVDVGGRRIGHVARPTGAMPRG